MKRKTFGASSCVGTKSRWWLAIAKASSWTESTALALLALRIHASSANTCQTDRMLAKMQTGLVTVCNQYLGHHMAILGLPSLCQRVHAGFQKQITRSRRD